MRVATSILNFSKRRGGAESYLADLCLRMAGEGYEVHVYAENWDEQVPEIHLHRIRTLPFPKSLRLLSFVIRSTREIEKGKYDVTIGVGHTLRADVLQPHGGVHWAWFWRSLRAYDSPLLWMVKFLGRILNAKQWVNGWIEDAPYKRTPPPRIIAISEMVKRDIVRWYGVPPDRVEVIYNGVDLERFHPRNRQYRTDVRERHGIHEEILLLFVSHNFRMRGLPHLMQALASLKKEGTSSFKLLVLGRDRQAPYLRLARETGISEEIIFAGATDEPEKYYGAADLFVHPSFYDACSLALLEALASGLPVVTTSSTGASGILSHGDDGWVIESATDREELKAGIRYFLDENTRLRASRQGRMKAERYSRQMNFERVMKVFQLLPERNRRA
jgi:UDP-glucose:(heptosyl)LPS alpha-1,3-glucosyltransferase